jgi:two-component system, sensor histidine kinase RegB
MSQGSTEGLLDRHRINFAWLIRLRWGAIAGQVATIVVVDRLVGIRLPLLPLAAVIAIELVANLAAMARARRPRPVGEPLLAAGVALDLVALTALLHGSGGPFNPFSCLYLVYLALAAVVLRPGWTWGLVALAAGGFATLFLRPGVAEAHAEHMRMHLQGMWVAFALAALFTVYFVTRVTQALARRDRELRSAREIGERNARLASLATLAAGAAHELSTPLATIATAAKELEREMADAPAAWSDDARLIREQVDRCRSILDHMAAEAGDATGRSGDGAAATACNVGALLDAALDGLDTAKRVHRSAAPEVAARVLAVPVRPVAQAIRAVVKNALDATRDGGEVELSAEIDQGALAVRVLDSGPGMAPEVLAHAGEPFFTTKPPGRGMGLGLFVTRTVIERLGGRVALESRPGAGTRALVTIPVERGA